MPSAQVASLTINNKKTWYVITGASIPQKSRHAVPQRKGLAFHPREFLTNCVDRVSLDLPHHFHNTHLRIDIQQQMNVVEHHFHLNHFIAVFALLFKDKFLEPLINAVNQHLVSALGTKNDVCRGVATVGQGLLNGMFW